MKELKATSVLVAVLSVICVVLGCRAFRPHEAKDFNYYKDLTPGQLLDEGLQLDVQIKELQDTKSIIVELATDKVKTIREPLQSGDIVKDPIEQLNDWLGL